MGPRPRTSPLLVVAATCACAPSPSGGAAPEVAWPRLSCDPIAPSYCGFPWPNNVFTAEAPDTATGRRLDLSTDLLPRDRTGTPIDPRRWNAFDGFSTAGPILVHLPKATDTGFPRADRIDRSLEADSPTILLDAETGERILHIAELDRSTPDTERRAIVITPGRALDYGRRYIVALRNIVDENGDPIPASPAFAALRDGSPHPDEPSVQERRPLYADIFQRLEGAGVDRRELVVAWDFTTASRDTVVGPLLHMRDEALSAGPIAYQVDSVDPDLDPDTIGYRIHGRMTVPMYLSGTSWPASLLVGADGLPEPSGTWDVPFEVLIPNSALDTPRPLLQYGHGLLGSRDQIESSHLRTFIDDYGYVLFAVDWIGMAEEDELFIGAALDAGRVQDLGTMMDRLHQGVLNALLAMRMMSTTFAQDPMFGAHIDPERRFYWGISQGGILGGVYMGLSQDVTRGCLEVMGQPYDLLLLRSVDFEPFFQIVRSTWPDPRDVQFVLALVQQLWDRVEPTGYTRFIRGAPLPGTPSHDVLLRAALGDHQVTTLGAHVMARTIGIPHVDTGLREVPGLEIVPPPHRGSGYVEYDFGLPPDPVCNVPQSLCEDPHGKVRRLDAAREQLDRFFREGLVENTCAGPCSFPDQSGCQGGESNEAACVP